MITAFTNTHTHLCLAVTGMAVARTVVKRIAITRRDVDRLDADSRDGTRIAVTRIAVTRIADTERERLAQAHSCSAQERRFAQARIPPPPPPPPPPSRRLQEERPRGTRKRLAGTRRIVGLWLGVSVLPARPGLTRAVGSRRGRDRRQPAAGLAAGRRQPPWRQPTAG